MQITTPISLGELLDKISILKIKKLNVHQLNKLTHINNELNILNKTLIENIKKHKVKLYLDKLTKINKKLWKIEDDIRVCEKNKDFNQKFINLANEYFGKENLVIDNIDKKAYLSGLSLAKYIIVTCDSTSMISEAAITGKPIYIADIPSKKNDHRFRKFRELFNNLNITKNLNEKLENWNYKSLNETTRIATEIKKKIL